MTRRLLPALSLLLVLVLPAPDGEARGIYGIHGPLVGHVGPREAHLWAFEAQRGRLEVQVRPADRPVWTPPQPMERRHGRRRASRAVISGLEPDTAYAFRLLLGGATLPEWQGGFRTAPEPGTPVRLRIAVASCMKRQRDPRAWHVLLAQRPHRLLLIGDNVYADSTRPRVLWAEHLAMRRIPEFADAIRFVPTLATWDDHDYAGNDTDGTARGKADSLATFHEVFANPSGGLPGVDGTFFTFTFGDVQVWMLDCRYHRSPNGAPAGPEKTMLGEGQERWLFDGLAASPATFKLIASSSTIDAKGKDSWKSFEHARRRLMDTIRDRGVEGVLFTTGDLHRCLVKVRPPDETGSYPIPEVISSGIANSDARGFVTLDFDTQVPDPEVTVRILRGSGRVQEVHVFRRSALRIPPAPPTAGAAQRERP